MICTQTTIELETRDGAFVCQGKQFASQEKMHEYLKSSCPFDVIKVVEETKSYFLHQNEAEFTRYETRGSLRKVLAREIGGAWMEFSGKKVQYLVDKGWIFSSIQKVSKEEFLSRLEPQAAKVAGVVLGILAIAPGAMELGRLLGYSQVATGLALYKYPTLGLALTMMIKVEAQAVGSEFQVNAYTTSDQRYPSAAPLNDGGFVVTWGSNDQDGDSWGVYGQGYDSSGVKSGVEFQVNTYTTSHQLLPSAAPLNDGGFVITWDSDGQDGDVGGVYGQRYASTGVKSGVEFQVNTYTTNPQEFPSVAPLNDGGFVVTWDSLGQDGNSYGVYGQRYDSSGVKNGVEFQVNTYTTSAQRSSSVAPLNDGGFVVIWDSLGQDGDSYGVYGQRYDSSGVKSGLEFQINTYTISNQFNPNAAPLNDGGFVVTWASSGQDGNGSGVYGQRYDSSGVKSGLEFQVNTYTTSNQLLPSAAPLNDGGFVVTWESVGQDGNGDGIYGQRYDSSGVKSGVEFQINTYTTSEQRYPSVASFNDGGFVVTWDSYGQDGDFEGIYGQRYDSNGNPIELILSNAMNTTSTLLSTSSSVPTGTQVGFTPSSPSSGGSSTSPSNMVSFSGSITISGEMIVYEVGYPIVVSGQTVGTYTISGGTGNFTNSNVNVLTIHFEDYQPQEGEVIPLFAIPEEEKEYWESIEIQGEAECIEIKGEVISEGEDDYVFIISFAEGNTCRVNQAVVVPALSLLLKV
ncbi:MAG: hypothetical protein K940chlam9_01840 [Chlamydiae bacterium]|nr:hypothetical protein [Chlamydiota bacterium]